jgi:hypothetical protein
MRIRLAFAMVLVGLYAVRATALADDKTTTPGTQQFEAMKKLVGDWVEIGKDGKPTDKLVSSIRLTAGGSVLQETLFPGGDHEMVTMYHLDGSNLILTHYCMLGNQPRLRAEPGDSVKKVLFKFVGSTNLKSDDEHHMNQVTFTLVDNDHFQAEWLSCKDGKECHKANFDLVRKPK